MIHNPYLKNMRPVVFDIETTGLYFNSSRVICSGFCDVVTGEVTQIFAENAGDETRLLRETVEKLSEYDAVITYNGDSFDLPFVSTRARKLGAAMSLPPLWKIDLYKWIKRYWKVAKLMESHTQKAVEEAMGLKSDRTDEIKGGDCISQYARYLQTGDPEAKRLILLHNADDVRQLKRIGDGLSSLPYHEIVFSEGRMFRAASGPINIRRSAFKGDVLRIEGDVTTAQIPADIYTDTLRFSLSSGGKWFIELSLRRSDEPEKTEFVDLRKLPVEEKPFKDLSGFYEGFLILRKSGNVEYAAVNRLTEELLESLTALGPVPFA